MVAVTYDVKGVSAAAGKIEKAERAAPRKGFFARFVDALIEARMAQVRREMVLYLGLLPDESGDCRGKTGSTEMPFGGW